MANFPASWAYQNQGTSGATLVQMLAGAAPNVNTQWQAGSTNIVFLWGGTNDLFNGSSTAAQIYANTKTYKSNLTHPFYLVIVGMDPRTGTGTPGTFEADRQTIRSDFLADFTVASPYSNIWLPGAGITYADAYIDIGADANVGCPTCSNNLTYYISDGTHETNAGYAIDAAYATNIIKLFTCR